MPFNQKVIFENCSSIGRADSSTRSQSFRGAMAIIGVEQVPFGPSEQKTRNVDLTLISNPSKTLSAENDCPLCLAAKRAMTCESPPALRIHAYLKASWTNYNCGC